MAHMLCFRQKKKNQKSGLRRLDVLLYQPLSKKLISLFSSLSQFVLVLKSLLTLISHSTHSDNFDKSFLIRNIYSGSGFSNADLLLLCVLLKSELLALLTKRFCRAKGMSPTYKNIIFVKQGNM